ncbi:MAG: M55 family metallopeptidase [Kiritimatiellaeota bacterium]|nr:M55 family metallopeptidase [Kiritimatiellota bacterium]
MSNCRIMVRCDMEGVSGVVSPTQAEPGAAEFDFGLRMFRSDLVACLEGLKRAGVTETVVYDEHYYGRNVDPAWLPDGVSVIAGKPPYRPDWAGGLDETFSGMVLLGFHSMCGTGELLHHTYEPDIRELRINGVTVGEIGMEAAVAGDFGVPVILVTADSAGVREARQLLLGVPAVPVKESLGETAGRCLPLRETAAAIRAAAAESMTVAAGIRPFRVASPVRLEVSFNPGPYFEAVKREFAESLTPAHSMVIEGRNATEVWALYWQRKLVAQAAVQK